MGTLTTPATVPSGPPVRAHGLLAVAQPAPEGWESGGIEVQALCPSPIIRDKCITLGAPDPAGRPSSAVFPAFLIEQGSECSTLSRGDRAAEAREALLASTDYALALTLRNGVANGGAPSLADATPVVGPGAGGLFPGPIAALAALETAASAGVAYVVHASPSAAVALRAAGLIDDAGRTPSGASVIISGAYSGAPSDPPRIWATGRVWAAAADVGVYDAAAHRINDRAAWAVRSAIVGFNTCTLITAAFALPIEVEIAAGGFGIPAYSGAGAPTPLDGDGASAGDTYLDTETGDLYQWQESGEPGIYQWSLIATIPLN